jgi:hypothetical protein
MAYLPGEDGLAQAQGDVVMWRSHDSSTLTETSSDFHGIWMKNCSYNRRVKSMPETYLNARFPLCVLPDEV